MTNLCLDLIYAFVFCCKCCNIVMGFLQIRASPHSSADVATKLSTSIDSSLGNGLQTPNTITSPPTVRRASTGEGVKHGSDNTEGPNKCPICGKGFNKPTYLKRHILSHSSVKPYKCDICNWGEYKSCSLNQIPHLHPYYA